jgi:hypothetical protein
MLARQFVAVLRAQIRLEGFDKGSEPNHLTLPQVMPKPFIKPLMRSKA